MCVAVRKQAATSQVDILCLSNSADSLSTIHVTCLCDEVITMLIVEHLSPSMLNVAVETWTECLEAESSFQRVHMFLLLIRTITTGPKQSFLSCQNKSETNVFFNTFIMLICNYFSFSKYILRER